MLFVAGAVIGGIVVYLFRKQIEAIVAKIFPPKPEV